MLVRTIVIVCDEARRLSLTGTPQSSGKLLQWQQLLIMWAGTLCVYPSHELSYKPGQVWVLLVYPKAYVLWVYPKAYVLWVYPKACL